MVQEFYSDVDSVVAAFVAELMKRIRVQRVILFGSYAEGRPRPWSDIDLAVISSDFHGGTEEDHLLLTEVARLVTPQIEAIPYMPEDFEACDPRSFESVILKRGRVVFESAA
jgi:predicted nucleotidyltransferase